MRHVADRPGAAQRISGNGSPIAARLSVYLTYALSIIALLFVWHVVATYVFPSILFPAPVAVLQKLIELVRTQVLLEHVSISLQRILLGFLLGSLVGVPIGLLMGNSRLVRRFLDPYIEFFRFIPPIAFLTPAVIWFGIGEYSKVFLIIYTTVFIVILNTTVGVLRIPENKIRAARCLGASRKQIFVHVSIPATVPFVLTGMRLAMGNSFGTIVAAEMLGASAGIGTLIWTSRMFMLVEDMFVGLVTLGLLGFATDRLFRWLIFRFARKYSPIA